VRLEGGCEDRIVTLRVVDFGHGIAEQDQARVFEKFRTVRRSPTDDPGGDTGLGLPFCRLAVEHMGGQVGLSSTAGVGTVFTVQLPVHTPPE
jgi:signal transduction histidine kinase